MKYAQLIGACRALLGGGVFAQTAPSALYPILPQAKGRLRTHLQNPRYFTAGEKLSDGSLKAVYLTGSHTWTNLVDRGPSDPPEAFDFPAYLQSLQLHGHHFIRLWARHVTWYQGYGEGELWAGALPWVRTGPGTALDSKLAAI